MINGLNDISFLVIFIIKSYRICELASVNEYL